MLQINDVSFSYKKKDQLLKGVHLELKPNQVYGLFGLNGAGKTTLLNLIAGMLFPTSGSCTLHNKDTRLRHPDTLCSLFLVPEQFELPNITGDSFIGLHHPFYPAFDHEQLEESLSVFEVNPSRKLPELSFGQQKKFMIAFAISTGTELLILDEPTNGLDIPSKSQFRKLLAKLDTEQRSVIISTHQVRDLGSMIDHVAVLKDGHIVFDHSIEKICNRIAFKKIRDDESELVIYAEEILGGFNAMVLSESFDSNEADLELLFNGVMSETEKMAEVLQ